MSEITSHAQKLSQQPRVDLFEIDARQYDDGVLRFTAGPQDGKPVKFNGIEYQPMPITATGFERSTEGSLPNPTLRVTSLNLALKALIIRTNGLLGCPITRIRTFACFLDDGETPDPLAKFPPEVYRIAQRSKMNRIVIEFKLAVAMDQQSKKIPGRQIIRDTCMHSYRWWDGTQYRYDGVTCPYAGELEFDASGEEIIATDRNKGEDACGKRMGDCLLRYGTEQLPIWAFPGVGNY